MIVMMFFWLYLMVTVIMPLRIRRRWKLSISILAFISCFKLKVNSLLGVDWFSSPDGLPRPMLYVLVFLYGVGVIFLCLNLLCDTVQIVPCLWGICRRHLQVSDWLHWRSRVHGLELIISIIMTIWGLYQGAQEPLVKELDLTLPGLPPQAEGVTLAVLTDIHADPYFGMEHIPAMVRTANGTGADFMLILGDCVDGSPSRRLRYLEGLQGLRPRVATLGVTGNHEYLSGYGLWKPYFERWGIGMLENDHRDYPEQGLRFVGLSDPLGASYGYAGPDIGEALSGCSPGLSSIALVHRPGLVHEWSQVSPSLRPGLQVSGHTHGGMLPILRVFLGLFNGGYYGGLHDASGVLLYVSNGSGIWNGFPLRVFCPAEITVIRLHALE